MKKRFIAMLLVFFMLFSMDFSVAHATSKVSISKNSFTIEVGKTYKLNALVNGKKVTADAWASSDTSVATVNQDGLVKAKAAGSTVITAIVEGTSVESLVSVVKKSTVKTKRYNVLILDISGSMEGTPLKREKEAAKRFCKTVLNTDGANYIALVTLNASSKVTCEFTTSLSKLEKAIDKVTASGGTDMNTAFKKAGNLLDKIKDNKNTMKNIILCSDGIPQNGSKSSSGKYKSSDHEYFNYANTVYKTDSSLKKKGYFIYALGFFHNSTGNDLKFGKRLMKDLASKDKYYIVTDPNDIDEVFDTIANNITKTSINKSSLTLYVKDTYTLKAYVNGKQKSATWKSSKPSIATVNKNGKVTAKKAGTTTITGTVKGKKVTCKVTVKNKKVATSIKLNKSKATVYVKKTLQLKATVTGTKKSVTWSSSNKKIATVNKNGKVTGVKAGKATISATVNGKKATCVVTVKIKHPTYSQYFMVKSCKSRYGDKTINEYGVRLVTNKEAVITKCAVYLKKTGNSSYSRTIACKGKNITYATYVPYLAKNGKIIYDGLSTYGINTFSLRQDSYGVWSSKGSYSTINANLVDANGKLLTVKSTGVAGKNTKIFYDLSKMKAWMNK